MNKLTLNLLAVCGLLAVPQWASAQTFTGLQTGGLGLSTYTAPGAAPVSYTVTGTTGGEALVSIDYAVSNGSGLFGMAASGNLYSLAQSGANAYTATLSNSLGVAGVTTVDFNPAANRLRVYAGTANYRITPGSGGLISSDGTLAYNAGDVNFGITPALRANAYTNSFLGAGGGTTTLYSIDTTQDALIMNTGTPQFSGLTTIATLTLGGVRFDVTPGNTGFDIMSPSNGVNAAYLTRGSDLYSLNLTTGVLTTIGTQAGTSLTDLAVVPEPSTYVLFAVGALAIGVVAIRRRQAAA